MQTQEESENMGSPEERTTSRSRQHLLHSFAGSLVTIGHKAFGRIEDHLGGSLGTLVRTVAFAAGPFARRAEQHWLSSVYYIDTVILIMERIMTYVFPPLEPVFTKIDELAFFAESLPEKFDQVLDDLPNLTERLPLAQLSSLLKKFSDIMMDMTSSNEEREINMVQTAFHELPMEEEEYKDDQGGDQNEERMREEDYEKLSKMDEDMKEVEKRCEEILGALDKMGMVGEDDKNRGSVGEEGKGNGGGGGGGGAGGGLGEEEVKEVGSKLKNSSSRVTMRDQIEELFDEGWQQKPLRG